MRGFRLPIVSLFAGMLLLAGCSFTTPVPFSPEAEFAPAGAPVVAVRTENLRPRDRGGRTNRIGTVRGGYYNPFPLYERSAADIERVARLAVGDALAQAGIAAGDAGRLVLDVKVKNYWLAGFRQYYANVEYELELKGPGGEVLWNQIVNGSGGDSMSAFVTEAKGIVVVAFGTALREIADQAAVAFRSEPFQELVRGKGGASLPASAPATGHSASEANP